MPITYSQPKSKAPVLTVALLLLTSNLGSTAVAQVFGLPYSTRTRPYQGWTALVKGDNNTVGMSGATVALPSSISAMENNPAGAAMYLNGLGALVNKNSVNAPAVNHSGESITEYQWGIGTSIPPWGFGITYYSPASENAADSEVSVRQLRLTGSYLVLPNMSVGLSLEMDKAIRRFDGSDLNTNWYSYQLGALYKFENHWVLGASFKPGLDIPASTDTTSAASLAGFNQMTRTPELVTFGIGFMPNRFFKAGASLTAVMGTPETATLWDDTVAYGQRFTLQPRIGASYVLAEYRHWKAEFALGSYYEVARIENLSNRLHGTFSLDVNPYFFNTGVGADLSTTYKNWMVSVGVDFVRLIRTFDIIPPDPVPPLNGKFPKMLEVDADGLADGFTQGEEKSINPPTAAEVKQIVQDIPKKIQEKFGGGSKPAKKSKKRKTKKR